MGFEGEVLKYQSLGGFPPVYSSSLLYSVFRGSSQGSLWQPEEIILRKYRDCAWMHIRERSSNHDLMHGDLSFSSVKRPEEGAQGLVQLPHSSTNLPPSSTLWSHCPDLYRVYPHGCKMAAPMLPGIATVFDGREEGREKAKGLQSLLFFFKSRKP